MSRILEKNRRIVNIRTESSPDRTLSCGNEPVPSPVQTTPLLSFPSDSIPVFPQDHRIHTVRTRRYSADAGSFHISRDRLPDSAETIRLCGIFYSVFGSVQSGSGTDGRIHRCFPRTILCPLLQDEEASSQDAAVRRSLRTILRRL